MSWKPCRGGRVLFDKAIKTSHECYFEFYEAKTIKEKSKLAFKWYKADVYLGRANSLFKYFGQDFIIECLENKDTYKPFLKVATEMITEKTNSHA